jgi:hypothetical protein
MTQALTPSPADIVRQTPPAPSCLGGPGLTRAGHEP